ncbi:HTH-type transcriptional regulator MalT [Vibrio sp.]|nr:HTH-type transcriptional regulator MalT [Vibrio sp.]
MWIPSKNRQPARLHNAILRPRVLDLLKEATHYKLILFRSPAGYGKTTMAAQWLNEHQHIGWFNIDESDNDLQRFMGYLIRAIHQATQSSCPNTLKLAEKRQFSSTFALISELFTELHHFHDECFIVIDDYHLIHNDDIHEALKFFLKHASENFTLVVTSRTQPPLGTANLRVRDQMLEITHQLLAFDKEEVQRFFIERNQETLTPSTLMQLQEAVEGWASALQLISLQSQHQKTPIQSAMDFVLSTNQSHLWDYLAEEVFEQLSIDTRSLLMECSIFDHFNEHLVKQLTKRQDALTVIDTINRYGLFISSLEGENSWYRFHPLFADFLAHQRMTKMPGKELLLHSEAANAWLSLDAPHIALSHAKKANDSDLLADILNQYAWQLFNSGDLNVLNDAISLLSEEKLYSEPKLCMLQAWLAQSQHQYHLVGSLLDHAVNQMEKLNITLSSKDQGELNALLAQVEINKNNPKEALRLAELAHSQLDTHTYRSRIVATSVIGEVNHVEGQLNRALSLMQQTEKLAKQYQVYPQALWAMLQQSEILVAQGYVQSAFNIQDQALKFIEEHQLHQLPLHEFLLRSRAQILWCWNRIDEAEECTYKGLDVLGSHSPEKHLHSYSMLVRIALARGEVDKAGKFIEQVQHLLSQSTYHSDWKANADFALILYWQAKGDTEALSQWLHQADAPTQACNHFTQLQLRNIARVQLSLAHYTDAQTIVSLMDKESTTYHLETDACRNLIVESILLYQTDKQAEAIQTMEVAIQKAGKTGMMSNFLIEGSNIYPILNELVRSINLSEMDRHRIKQILKSISKQSHGRSMHFDEEFVERLIELPNIPELVRTSPLTQREWQVLGLIYSGFSNEQIAHELDVAGTTIKTHIRNLYQKLNISNRKEAIKTAESLLQMGK